MLDPKAFPCATVPADLGKWEQEDFPGELAYRYRPKEGGGVDIRCCFSPSGSASAELIVADGNWHRRVELSLTLVPCIAEDAARMVLRAAWELGLLRVDAASTEEAIKVLTGGKG